MISPYKRIHLKKIDSTNAFAKKLLIEKNNQSICFLITADYQTFGRGQFQKKWESQPYKNILLSFLVHPNLELKYGFYLSKIAALSVYKLISSYTKDVFIKWPNDIMVNKKKIAGILIENSISLDKVKSSIIGIGININQEQFTCNNLANATSLKILNNKEYLFDKLIKNLETIFSLNYLRLIQRDLNVIDKMYNEKLWKLNKKARYLILGQEKQAIIRGVDITGSLNLEIDNQVCSFTNRQISFLLE